MTWFRKDGLVSRSTKLDGFTTAKKTIDTACPRPGSAPAKVREIIRYRSPAKGKKR